MVKPEDADNSLGVTLVRTPAEYEAALEEAFAHAGRVLVEERDEVVVGALQTLEEPRYARPAPQDGD